MSIFKSFISSLFSLLFVLLLISCKGDVVETTDDPTELNVELSVLEDGSGTINVIATAKNTIEYRFFLNQSSEPNEVNSSGEFSYVFEKSGTYEIETRAFGESGRFIKDNKQFSVIVAADEVDPNDGYSSPVRYDGYTLVWNDEFNGTSLNEDDWTFEIGDGCPNCGWGNNELQYYRKENTSLNDGILTIEARKRAFQGKAYTSSRIITKGKQEFKYGRIDIRALLPEGQGIWPALWMLGGNISSVSWPACGEIDIMEMVGGSGKDNIVHGTLHYQQDGNHVYHGDKYKLSNKNFSDEFHVFSLVWDQNSLAWYVNNTQFYRVGITANHMSEFHQSFFFIFNLAVGGNWPGNPDDTTIFPQQMKVDYIRVFQPE